MEDLVSRALNTENSFIEIECNTENINLTDVAISEKKSDLTVMLPLVNLDSQITQSNYKNSAGSKPEESVLVYVRPRPLPKTVQDGEKEPFLLDTEHGKIRQVDGNHKCYRFDGVLHPECSQAELYQRVVQPLTAAVLRGYNATVLAYGQTGSGKTYTMGTAGENSQHKEKEGVLQRVLAELLPESSPRKSTGGKGGKIARHSRRISGKWSLHGGPADNSSKELDAAQDSVTPTVTQLFDNDKENTPGTKILLPVVELTFLEIHNEKVYDLLTSVRTQLATKPDNAGGVQAANCQQLPVRSRRHGLALVRAAAARRSVAETANNACSSRSHALVGIRVTRGLVSSVMWLVDLAGSECAGRLNHAALTVSDCSGSSRKVFDEGVAINKGLLALGKVLTARAAKSGHVPYRDSILTHLLRESVSGNSRTAMIACASLSPRHAAHTTTTLRYAEQARDVRTRPTLPPPTSVIKRLSVKRQYEDPTATPAAWKKRSTPAFKTVHHTPVAGKGEDTFGKLRHFSLAKPQFDAASSSVRASKTFLQPPEVRLNATVSTPGHTPSARMAKRPLNYSCLGESNVTSVPDGTSYKTHRGSHQLFQSLQQPVFEEEVSLQPSPSASIFTSLDNLECSIKGAKSKGGPLASSPLQGVSKLPRQSTGRRLRTPDVQAILRPLVTHLEQSIFMVEDRLTDKILARLTRSRVKEGLDVSTARDSDSCNQSNNHGKNQKHKDSSVNPVCTGTQTPAIRRDNSPCTLPTTPKTGSCLTPDLGDTVLDMMLCTSANRAGKKRKFEEALQRMVQKSMRGVGSTYDTRQLEATELTASQTVVAEGKMCAAVPVQLSGKKNAAKNHPGDNFLVPDIPLPLNKCNSKVKSNPKVLNGVGTNESTMLCDTLPQNGKLLTSTTYKNNRVIRRSSRMLSLHGQQEIEHDVSCIGKLPDDLNKKNGSKGRSGTVTDHNFPCKLRRFSYDESVQQNLLLGIENGAQVQLNDTTTLLRDNITMKDTDRLNDSIFDMSLLSFVPPKHRPAKPVKVRRSIRVAALRATELNHTLLCSSSPEVYTRYNRTVRRSNSRTQPLQLTLPSASPTVVKEHQQSVLHLLNTGTLKELQRLPTVGPKTAMVLSSYRTFYGKFSSLATLHQVPGLTKSFVTRFGKANLVHI